MFTVPLFCEALLCSFRSTALLLADNGARYYTQSVTKKAKTTKAYVLKKASKLGPEPTMVEQSCPCQMSTILS